MADQNLTQLTATTTPADTDLLYTVVDPSGTPFDRKITWTTVKSFFSTYFGGLFTSKLTPTAVQTTAYNAAVNDFIPVDLSSNVSFNIQLPTTPADKSRITITVDKVGTTGVVGIVCGGSDVFGHVGGSTTIYLALKSETAELQYQSSTGIWYAIPTSSPQNFATGFPGIDAMTPITNANITIDTTALTLTVTPPLGYFNIFVDGGGKITKYRKGTVVFGDGSGGSGNNTMTSTSGMWYFYFNSLGQPVTTQTAWKTTDFGSLALVARVLWNSTLTGAAKLVAWYIEYHLNDISADDHQYMHQNTGSICLDTTSSFICANNALASGAPAVNGSNTVISLTTGSNVDDNLEYTVTNNTSGSAWTQDMGNTLPASLTSSNSGLFQVRYQDASANQLVLAATRFPFSYSAGNIIEYITATGVRTAVTDKDFVVWYVYATQNPRVGEAIKVVSAPTQFTSQTNAEASSWDDILNTYSVLASDPEIRPLYRLIYESRNTGAGKYDVATKYAALREVQDLRRTPVTSVSTITGSIPASSVTFVPYGTIGSTNVQSGMQELSDETVQLAGVAGGQVIVGGTLTTQGMTLRPNAADLTTGAIATLGTLEATNTTTASVTVAGGLAVAKRVYALDMTVTNTITGTTSGNYVTGGALGTPASGTLSGCTGLPISGLTSSTSTALGVGSIELGAASDTTLSRTAAGMLAVEGTVLNGWTTSATSGGTTTLTIADATVQFRTGTSTSETIKLPTTGVKAGQTYEIRNNCTTTGLLTIQSSAANTIIIISAGAIVVFRALQDTPTADTHWSFKKYAKNGYTVADLTTDTGTTLNADWYDSYAVTALTGALKFNNPTGTPRNGQTLLITVASSTTAARALTWDTTYEASTVALPTTTAATTAQLNIGFIYSVSRATWVCVAVA